MGATSVRWVLYTFVWAVDPAWSPGPSTASMHIKFPICLYLVLRVTSWFDPGPSAGLNIHFPSPTLFSALFRQWNTRTYTLHRSALYCCLNDANSPRLLFVAKVWSCAASFPGSVLLLGIPFAEEWSTGSPHPALLGCGLTVVEASGGHSAHWGVNIVRK